mgnify:CR=1 FL=1
MKRFARSILVMAVSSLALVSTTSRDAVAQAGRNAPKPASGSDSAMARYAARIVETADRAIGAVAFLTPEDVVDLVKGSITASSPPERRSFDSTGRLALHALGEIERRTKDFDVVAPPAQLERAHAQMMAALQRVSQGLTLLVRQTTRCKSRPGDFAYCSTPLTDATIDVMGGEREYDEARGRAARLLGEQGLSLSDRPSTKR